MERAAYFSAWREKEAAGDHSRHTPSWATRPPGWSHTHQERHLRVRSLPEMDDLFMRQAASSTPGSARPGCTGCQTIMTEHVLNVPIYDLAFIWGVGPASR